MSDPPRWVTDPLVADWLDPDELRPPDDPLRPVDRHRADMRYRLALAGWCADCGTDPCSLDFRQPAWPDEAPGIDPDAEPAPREARDRAQDRHAGELDLHYQPRARHSAR